MYNWKYIDICIHPWEQYHNQDKHFITLKDILMPLFDPYRPLPLQDCLIFIFCNLYISLHFKEFYINGIT